jgi:SAM-dependent methyltransferase
MNELEKKIYNEGERLIPGVSHDANEVKRHFSSYSFFRDLINENVRTKDLCPIIVDLGCGVGYGCKVLSELNGSVVMGIDCSDEVIEYAMSNYAAPNIAFRKEDIKEFVSSMKSYDYVVSRGVFEHIEDGLEIAKRVKFNELFMFDVPYDEKQGNPHHKILGIKEDSFEDFGYADIYYEDIKGNITKIKPEKPNMIMCVCKRVSRTKGSDDE